ncbi:MAG: T9SS type A sorting domain-containing protein [Bacteroidetes bacterium]|nr:T9SS type A sorting domain-containing protein [Bacteroidota bacterium]
MRATVTCLLAFFAMAISPLFSQTTVQDVVVKVTATVDVATPKVTINFENPAPSELFVFRREKGSTDWYLLLQQSPSSVTNFVDNLVSLGQTYEYGVQRQIGGVYAFGYVTVPLEAPVVDQRGIMSVFVEEALETPLATELERLRLDLIGDGWQLRWHSVPTTATVETVKSQIVDDYTNDGINSVFLFGEIPVPYSGNTNWDGHPDHQGAWPADSYYSDIDSDFWSDEVVNTANNGTQPSRPETVNVPGDGKFDNSFIPTTSELQVGRVDFSNLSEATFGTTQLELYRRYLDKNHNWRSKQYTVDNKVLVDDNFGYFSGEAFAENGYRNGYPLVGESNVAAGNFFEDTNDNSFLFAYGTGPGSYTSAGGVGTSAQFASDTVNVVFMELFGSYHGDWDSSPNPLMMSALASKGGVLNCSWAGRPHWFIHHLGAGETIGYCALETQNACDNLGYFDSFGACGAHVSLLGDPSVRAQIVAPVSNLVATPYCDKIEITWAASPQPNVIGYHVYRSASLNGYYDRLTGAEVTGLSFTDDAPLTGDNFYLVKALVREETPSGIFFNTSTGVSVGHNFVPGAPPTINVPAMVTLNCANPSYLLDPCGPGVDCVIKGTGGVMNPAPYTVTSPGNYVVVAIDISSGCSATATLSVTLDNLTPVPTTGYTDYNCEQQTAQLIGNAAPSSVDYSWSGPAGFSSAEQNPIVPASGVYILTVSASNGCTATSSVTVPPFVAPGVAATGGDISCSVTSVQLMGDSNTPGVTYFWMGPNGFQSNEQNPVVSLIGDYTLIVTASNGCTATATTSVGQMGDLPQASASASGMLNCITSEVTLMANPDMSGYSFAWTGPNGFSSTEENPLVTVAGTYNLLVTNTGTGCSSMTSVNLIDAFEPPLADPMAQGILSCIVTSVTLVANPAESDYSFAWEGPNGFASSAENPVVLEPGTYSVSITSGTTGCVSNYSVEVLELVAPTFNFDIPTLEVNCSTTEPVLDLSAICTLPGLTCKLNGQIFTGPVVINPVVTNVVEVFDNASGCLMASDTVQINTQTDVPTLNVAGETDLLCADDLATLTASSNTPNTTIEWDGLGSNPTQTVPPGTYLVTATGTNSCETSQTIVVTAPSALTLDGAGIIDCDGNFDPAFVAAGGTAPYNYSYSPQPPFPPGTNFEITVTDFNGCTASVNGTVDLPVPPEFGILGTNETVLGANDGMATAVFDSGVPPFTYLWSNGQTTQTVENLAPGTYTCTITGSNGCSVVGTVIIEPGVNATTDLPGLRRLALSPNPSDGRFQLTLELENPMPVKVELLEVVGRILTTTKQENVVEKTWQFDLTDSPSGVYFCKIVAEGKVAVLKVVRE